MGDSSEGHDCEHDDSLEDYDDYGYDDYDSEHDYDDRPKVLVVGEKPAVARSLKKALEDRPFLEFQQVVWIFSSTRGHVFDTRFKGSLPVWDHRKRCYHVDQQSRLFEKELETFSKDEERQNWYGRGQDYVEDILAAACESIDFLLLCLDNDLEGESIAAEVESLLASRLEPPRFGWEQQIWRCTFSSLDQDSLRRAVRLPPDGTLQDINRDFVEAVRVRRELDLRLGFAFSRAQKHLVWNVLVDYHTTAADKETILRVCQGFQNGGIENGDHAHELDNGEDEDDPVPNSSQQTTTKSFDPAQWPVLSYGPCQLPTLGFVVRNAVDISCTVVKPFWKIKANCRAGTHALVAWSEPFHDEHLAHDMARRIRDQTKYQTGMPETSHARTPQTVVVELESSTLKGYQRPKALCTSRMLQLASDCLGISPAVALDLAENLYLAAWISYPRSETDSYDPETDLEEIVTSVARRHPVSNDVKVYAKNLLEEGLAAPRQDGHNAGDHPPIMPLVSCDRRPPEGAAADLYDLIVRVFLASVSPDAVIEQTSVIIEVPFGGCSLRATGQRVHSLGWIEVLPILDAENHSLPDSARQAAMGALRLEIEGVSVERFATEPPPRLTEAKLLVLMEMHGIGTDASMPSHIEKIIERSYVEVDVSDCQQRPRGVTASFLPGNWFRSVRTLHPTHQGSSLFRWYMLFGKDLALPSVRADVEAAYLEVSRGERSGKDVLDTFIKRFWWQFWDIFDPESQNSTRARNTLINFLKQTAEGTCWQRAEHMISLENFQEMADSRTQQMEGAALQSAPATVAINHCLMIDAKIVKSSGALAPAKDVLVGDSLLAVFVQNGQLMRGQCSVKSIRCYRTRERDVATLHWRDSTSVKATSNHSFLVRPVSEHLLWGPIVARDLSSSHCVVFDEHIPRGNLNNAPGQVVLQRVSLECLDTRVIEMELDCGEAACWLLASPTGFIAAYGEVPKILPFQRRHVAVWGFSRCPPEFRQALRESCELAACRQALIDAGFSFQLRSGGHMFVQPEDATLVKHALKIHRIFPKASEVVVAPEFETQLQEALGLRLSTSSIYPRRKREMQLDTAMSDMPAYRNGRPFSYVTGGRFVQGRRTFIDLEEVLMESSMARSAATI